MIRATISEVKNGLSAYLRRVQSGESVLVMERRTPVARIVPVGHGAEGRQEIDAVDSDAKLVRLVQAGIVTRHGASSPREVLKQPVGQGGGLLEAVLEGRTEERHEGSR